MRLSKQTKIVMLVLAMVATLVGGEVAFEWWRGSEVVIRVENAGTAPIHNLVLTYGSSKSFIPLIEPERSVKIFVNGSNPHSLALNFEQAGNPLNSFELPEFSPSKLESEGLLLNVRIRTNGEIERYGEQSDEVGSPLMKRYRRVRNELSSYFFGDQP